MPDERGADQAWNEAQRRVIELLGRSDDDRDVDPGLVEELRTELHDGLADLASELSPERQVFVAKHALATVNGCEAQFLAGQGEFRWSVAAARGIVAHKAIEVMVNHRAETYPGELVDEAISRMVDDERSAVGAFLAGLPEFDLADLRSTAVAKVAQFQECFPPLKYQWYPVLESRTRVELFGARIVFSGKTDLTLGRPPHKVIIDLKSGWTSATHREDLRFYALLETLKLGRPPRKLASYYLDTASTHPETVDEGVLRTAARRAIDGTRRIIELTRLDGEPTKRPGPQCRWCPLQRECEEGAAALARADDPDRVDADPWF